MSTRFVVISDTHFYAPGSAGEDSTFWNGALQTQSHRIGECLIDTVRRLSPDFVIHCGDVTGLCDLENWHLACQIMDGFPCPWYAALGNHDTWYPGVRDAFSLRFELPQGAGHYRRDLGGISFLFLDLVHWHDQRGGVSPYRDPYDPGQKPRMGASREELQWLDAELAACAGRPVVLVSHPPLAFKASYPVASWPKELLSSDSGSLAAAFGEVVGRHAILETVRRCPNVKAAFAGHWHIHDATQQSGIVHCQTASLREFPFEIRTVEVAANLMTITAESLDDPSFAAASYIPAWGNDWVVGGPADRSLTIRLD